MQTYLPVNYFNLRSEWLYTGYFRLKNIYIDFLNWLQKGKRELDR